MKKPYLYVEARGWFDPNYMPLPGAPVRQEQVFNGEPVSFADCRIDAKDDAEAYQLGAAQMDTLRAEDPTRFHLHFTGQFLNDYVVAL